MKGILAGIFGGTAIFAALVWSLRRNYGKAQR